MWRTVGCSCGAHGAEAQPTAIDRFKEGVKGVRVLLDAWDKVLLNLVCFGLHLFMFVKDLLRWNRTRPRWKVVLEPYKCFLIAYYVRQTFAETTFLDRMRCSAQLLPGSSFVLSALRFF